MHWLDAIKQQLQEEGILMPDVPDNVFRSIAQPLTWVKAQIAEERSTANSQLTWKTVERILGQALQKYDLTNTESEELIRRVREYCITPRGGDG